MKDSSAEATEDQRTAQGSAPRPPIFPHCPRVIHRMGEGGGGREDTLRAVNSPGRDWTDRSNANSHNISEKVVREQALTPLTSEGYCDRKEWITQGRQ